MILFYYGKEDFLLSKKVRELKTHFEKKYPAGKVEFFDFDEGADVLAQSRNSFHQGGGLFSTQKLIILSNYLALSKDQQPDLEKLLMSYGEISQDIIVLVIQPEIKDKRNKLFKYLLKAGKAEELMKLEGIKLRQWIQREISQRSNGQVQIQPAALERLIMISGTKLWQLDQELEKLVNYFDFVTKPAEAPAESNQSKMIDLALINLLCQGEVESKIFDLVDAIGQRQKARANELVYLLIEQGENDFYIFTMIMFQLRNLVKIQEAQKKVGPNQTAISQKLKLHAFVVGKGLNQLRNFSFAHLKSIYNLATELDLQVKTGDKSMTEALTYFIAKI